MRTESWVGPGNEASANIAVIHGQFTMIPTLMAGVLHYCNQ